MAQSTTEQREEIRELIDERLSKRDTVSRSDFNIFARDNLLQLERMNARIEASEQKFNARFDSLERKLNAHIESVATRFANFEEKVKLEIESSAPKISLELHKSLQTQTIWIVIVIFAALGLLVTSQKLI